MTFLPGPPDPEVTAAAIAIRRALHAEPELAFEEHRTAALIAARLGEIGLDVTRGIGGTGVVGVLRGGDGPMVGFRADMDALPITETNPLPFASKRPGVMHACGHDGHIAMLLGAADQLARRGDFGGSVAFIFQPAEENDAGAKALIEDGLFGRFPIGSMFGLHNFPGLALGCFGTRPGAMLASFEKFEIEVKGTGGHSAMPHLARDALQAAAAIALGLPDTMRRRLDPLLPAVVSVTSLHAGNSHNVIPDRAVLTGSFRTLDDGAHEAIATLLAPTAAALASVHGCQAGTRQFSENAYPVLVNSDAQTHQALAAAVAVAGEERVSGAMKPLLGAEDFAFYLHHRPGNFIGLGNGVDSAPLHTGSYNFNDQALPLGIAYWVSLAHRLGR